MKADITAGALALDFPTEAEELYAEACKAKDPDLIIQCTTKAISLCPGEERLYDRRFQALFLLRRYEEAIKDAEKLMECAPEMALVTNIIDKLCAQLSTGAPSIGNGSREDG